LEDRLKKGQFHFERMLGSMRLISTVNFAQRLLINQQKSQPGLKIILLSGAAIDPRGWTLIRKPFMQSDLMRVMQATTGLC
jgi:hypothetical protein